MSTGFDIFSVQDCNPYKTWRYKKQNNFTDESFGDWIIKSKSNLEALANSYKEGSQEQITLFKMLGSTTGDTFDVQSKVKLPDGTYLFFDPDEANAFIIDFSCITESDPSNLKITSFTPESNPTFAGQVDDMLEKITSYLSENDLDQITNPGGVETKITKEYIMLNLLPSTIKSQYTSSSGASSEDEIFGIDPNKIEDISKEKFDEIVDKESSYYTNYGTKDSSLRKTKRLEINRNLKIFKQALSNPDNLTDTDKKALLNNLNEMDIADLTVINQAYPTLLQNLYSCIGEFSFKLEGKTLSMTQIVDKWLNETTNDAKIQSVKDFRSSIKPISSGILSSSDAEFKANEFISYVAGKEYQQALEYLSGLATNDLANLITILGQTQSFNPYKIENGNIDYDNKTEETMTMSDALIQLKQNHGGNEKEEKTFLYYDGEGTKTAALTVDNLYNVITGLLVGSEGNIDLNSDLGTSYANCVASFKNANEVLSLKQEEAKSRDEMMTIGGTVAGVGAAGNSIFAAVEKAAVKNAEELSNIYDKLAKNFDFDKKVGEFKVDSNGNFNFNNIKLNQNGNIEVPEGWSYETTGTRNNNSGYKIYDSDGQMRYNIINDKNINRIYEYDAEGTLQSRRDVKYNNNKTEVTTYEQNSESKKLKLSDKTEYIKNDKGLTETNHTIKNGKSTSTSTYTQELQLGNEKFEVEVNVDSKNITGITSNTDLGDGRKVSFENNHIVITEGSDTEKPSRKIKFDSEGKVTEQIDFNYNNNQIEEIIKDKEGKPTEKKIKKTEGSKTIEQSFTYNNKTFEPKETTVTLKDSQGNVIKQVFDKDGNFCKIDETTVAKVDKTNRVISTQTKTSTTIDINGQKVDVDLDKSGNFKSGQTVTIGGKDYTVKDNNKLVNNDGTIEIQCDSKTGKTTTTEFNNSTSRIKKSETIKDLDGSFEINEFDNSGTNKTKSTMTDKFGNKTETTFENGNKKTIKETKINGDIVETQIEMKDDKQVKTKTTTKLDGTKTIEEFDDDNNIIKKTEIKRKIKIGEETIEFSCDENGKLKSNQTIEGTDGKEYRVNKDNSIEILGESEDAKSTKKGKKANSTTNSTVTDKQVLERIEIDESGKQTKFSFNYDEKGNIKNMKRIDADGREFSIEYDYKKKIQKISIDENTTEYKFSGKARKYDDIVTNGVKDTNPSFGKKVKGLFSKNKPKSTDALTDSVNKLENFVAGKTQKIGDVTDALSDAGKSLNKVKNATKSNNIINKALNTTKAVGKTAATVAGSVMGVIGGIGAGIGGWAIGQNIGDSILKSANVNENSNIGKFIKGCSGVAGAGFGVALDGLPGAILSGGTDVFSVVEAVGGAVVGVAAAAVGGIALACNKWFGWFSD